MNEERAREIIEEFLNSEGWKGDYGLEFQIAEDPDKTAWAFWGEGRPYTSYLKMDGTIESYGI